MIVFRRDSEPDHGQMVWGGNGTAARTQQRAASVVCRIVSGAE